MNRRLGGWGNSWKIAIRDILLYRDKNIIRIMYRNRNRNRRVIINKIWLWLKNQVYHKIDAVKIPQQFLKINNKFSTV